MIILSALAGGLVYLGLAVLGWGGFAAFFAHPARLALAAVLFVLTATALFSQGNLSAGEREDRGNRWVIGAIGLIGLVSAYVPAYTDRTDFWTLDGDALRWIGVAIFAAGGVLRLWPVFVLGRRFSCMLPDDRAGPSPPRRPRCNPPAQCDAPLARTSVRPASVDGSVSRLAGCSDGRGAARSRSIADGLDAGRAPPPDAHAGDRG